MRQSRFLRERICHANGVLPVSADLTKFRITLIVLLGTLGGHTYECVAQESDPLTIRVESREVFIPVYVLDKRHAQFRDGYADFPEWMGLSREDFSIFEDGKEQQIRDLTLEVHQAGLVVDNFNQHIEYSCTPKGIWAGPDTAGWALNHLFTFMFSRM